MSGLFGMVRFDGGPVDRADIDSMGRAMSQGGLHAFRAAATGSGGMGRLHRADAISGVGEGLPRLMADGRWLVAASRVDNRTELAGALGLQAADAAAMADEAFIEQSWLRWGEQCPERVLGDWAFAVWSPAERRLYLARDHHGNTALYWARTRGGVAFASSLKGILALRDPALRAIDDLFLAQLLLANGANEGEVTAWSAIRRVPPAHALAFDRGGVRRRVYWRLDEVRPAKMRSLAEASEGLLAVLEEAVRCRLRGIQIGATLSGGLDSGSVAALAARQLALQGRDVFAYTSVPVSATALSTPGRFGDEWGRARESAAFAGIVNHRPVVAGGLSPLEALRNLVRIHDEPTHAAGNGYWMQELTRTARADGCDVLLTGQGGNGGISWPGARSADPAQRTAMRRLKRWIRRRLPGDLGVRISFWRYARGEPWLRDLAIHPDLVRRTGVIERSLSDPQHPLRIDGLDPIALRLGLIRPARSTMGCFHAQSGAAFGIEIRDPTLDARVLSHCMSIPDELHHDRATNMDRMVIRAAMAGRLPDSVRLNRQRGLQAADLPFRLRADRAAMESCLQEMANGPAAGYLDAARLRRAWSIVLARDDAEAYREALVVLVRSLSVGVFVNGAASAGSTQ